MPDELLLDDELDEDELDEDELDEDELDDELEEDDELEDELEVGDVAPPHAVNPTRNRNGNAAFNMVNSLLFLVTSQTKNTPDNRGNSVDLKNLRRLRTVAGARVFIANLQPVDIA